MKKIDIKDYAGDLLNALPEAIQTRMYPQDVPGTYPMANRDPHVTYYGKIVEAYMAD